MATVVEEVVEVSNEVIRETHFDNEIVTTDQVARDGDSNGWEPYPKI
jgi:hypothetical protein